MPNTKKTRSRRKELYRVRNWSEYDRALVQRGSLTVWIADGFEKTWFYQGPLQRGSQFDYSAQAIEIMLTLKNVFHLPNRATEGFASSLFGLLKIGLPVPDHTTLSRRGKIAEGFSAEASQRAPGSGHGQHRAQDLRRRRVESAHAWQIEAAHLAQAPSHCGSPQRRNSSRRTDRSRGQ